MTLRDKLPEELFPDWKKVLSLPRGAPAMQVQLNAKLLHTAAQSLGGDGEVSVKIGGKLDPVCFTSDKRRVVVMPMRTTNKPHTWAE